MDEQTPDEPRTSRKTTWILGGTAIAIVAICGGWLAASQTLTTTETTRHEFTEPIQKLELDLDAGNAQIVAGRSGTVTVEATSEYFLTEPDLTFGSSGGVLSVTSDCGSWLASPCDVDLLITVPAGTAVTADSSAGDVSLTGPSGILDLETDAGDITAAGLSASEVHASTDAGDIELQLAHAPQVLDADADAGSVDIELPAGAYALDTSTDAGEIELDGLVADAGARRLIAVDTGAGDVSIRGV